MAQAALGISVLRSIHQSLIIAAPTADLGVYSAAVTTESCKNASTIFAMPVSVIHSS
jgi:hypothetical protein